MNLRETLQEIWHKKKYSKDQEPIVDACSITPVLKKKSRLPKLQYLLTISFFTLTIIPLTLTVYYLHSEHTEELKALQFRQLASMTKSATLNLKLATEALQENALLISSNVTLNKKMTEWKKNSSPTALNSIHTVMRNAQDKMNRLVDVQLFDTHHQFITNLKREQEINKRIFYPSTIDKTKIVLDRENNELLIQHTNNLNYEGQELGYMTTYFKADFINDILSNKSALGKTARWLLVTKVDTTNILIAQQGGQFIEVPVDETTQLGKEKTSIRKALMVHKSTHQFAYQFYGDHVLANIRYISSLSSGLAIKIHEQEVFDNTISSLARIKLAVGFMGIISLIVGISMSHFIARPIEALSRNIKSHKGSNFKPAPLHHSWLEARDLADSFNKLMKNAFDLSQQLETKSKVTIEALSTVNRHLREISIRDPLTNLYNRRHINEVIDREINISIRQNIPLVIAMIDIDHFKEVNDTYGHQAGDTVLEYVSSFLQRSSRKSDTIARVGGEEFMVSFLVSHKACRSNPPEYLNFLEYLRIGIEDIKIPINALDIQVTVSIGAALLYQNLRTFQEISALADKALYEAKRSGRNKTVINQSILTSADLGSHRINN